MSNEQWKEQGKCNICRKQKYCTTKCKACKERIDYEIKCKIAQTAFGKIFNEYKK